MRRRRVRGVTLVEVAIVVVIVAILSVVALVGYRRYRAAARMSEATTMLTGIRTAQNEYKHETGLYANVSRNADALHPSASPGKFVTQWKSECTACNELHGWERIKFSAPGPVMYGYATVAGVGGGLSAHPPSAMAAAGPPAAADPGPTMPTLRPSEPFFLAIAKGDTDGNGVPCTIIGNSHTNQLFITNEGE